MLEAILFLGSPCLTRSVEGTDIGVAEGTNR